jgi:hypothetical protein
MKLKSVALAVSVPFLAAATLAEPNPAQAEPVRIEGPEPTQLDLSLPDGGLPPAVGVRNYEVFRASRTKPDLADGKGWTYNHHVDMACWKGRLYVAWSSGQRDEDTWPWHELYSTSTDGIAWSAPAELFPQGVSTPLRMYFFCAPNGRMLAIAGLRLGETRLQEKNKHSLVVREILANHALGPVFTMLARGTGGGNSLPAMFTEAADKGFVEACTQLLGNRTYLEQQDYGTLLGDRRMKWHASDDKGMELKAMSFFHRKDGALVGIGKKGWVTVSTDEGNTWSKPVRPSSLVTGNGKVWGQRISDGRFALLYDPDKDKRYPLVNVTSDDGATFRDMRVVHGEIPIQRYAGANKQTGPSYVRGVSEWSGDGSWKDNGLWVVYSMNKEDIWVSRIPVPVRPTQTEPVADNFTDWNIYSAKWAPVSVIELPDGKSRALRLEDRDPYDYARAVRVFPESQKVRVTFQVLAQQTNKGPLEMELLSAFGGRRPVRLSLAEDGKIKAVDGNKTVELASYSANQWLTLTIEADAVSGKFTASLSGNLLLKDAAFAENVPALQRLSFRTGPHSQMSDQAKTSVTTDAPVEPAIYVIQEVKVTP